MGFASNEQNKPVLNLFCYLNHPLLFSMGMVWYGNILLLMAES